MRNWLWLVLVVAWTPSAWAGSPTTNDFAYGIKIAVPDGTAVAAMSLPSDVYKSVIRKDLGDCRVFNANGEPVAHMIRYALTRPVEAPWRTLPFFPLPDAVEPDAGGYRVHVRTGADGAVVRVDPHPARPPSQPVRTYLIDLSSVRIRLAQLRLAWQSKADNFMASLAVDASNDLVNWTTIQRRVAISDIHYGRYRLFSNIITLARGTKKKYLRLRQLDAGPAIVLINIAGRIQTEDRRIIRAFMKIDGRAVADSPGVFEYVTSGAFPVDRVNLIFDEANSIADTLVESRDHSTAAWTRRSKGLFYRIDVDDIPLTSAPQAVPISMDRFWRLTVDASDSTIGSGIPRLEVGYRPHHLFFVARGSGPFTLAFGSAAVKPPTVDMSALFDGISRQHDNGPERWVIPQGKRFVLGGTQRLSPVPKPLPMRQILLWSVLLAGVMVVAGMAWQLARRLKAGSIFY